MLELTDTHTHLDSQEFAEDREAVIHRAHEAGITRIITIGAGAGVASARNAIALAEAHEKIWATVGIHPHDAKTEFDPAAIETLARHPKVVAIGETGLDFYRDWSPSELQDRWFRAQIEIAKRLSKPLVIHSRSAGPQCLAILQEMDAAQVGGVFHCYAEDAAFASELAKINFLVSFPGALTFKKAEHTRAVAREIPLAQIMLETDAPYMAPEPHRGRRCESAYVREIAQVLSGIKGLPLEEIAHQTTANAQKLFGIV